jgi:8-oxo-dGTP pyrophosphatase MutT (NUDIX family)
LIVTTIKDKKYVLLQKRDITGGGYWNMIGGGMDDTDVFTIACKILTFHKFSPIVTVFREYFEEAGQSHAFDVCKSKSMVLVKRPQYKYMGLMVYIDPEDAREFDFRESPKEKEVDTDYQSNRSDFKLGPGIAIYQC